MPRAGPGCWRSVLTGLFALSALFDPFAEYDWTPVSRENGPSMYLYELINWLTTVVDSLAIKTSYKDGAYVAAVQYIADWYMV